MNFQMIFNLYWTIWVICLPLLIQTKKPSSKARLAVWRLECELGVITDPDCPVDGGWSPWSPWSPCQGSCDDIGHRRKTRECINPPPSQEGALCRGSDELIETCFLNNCSPEDFRKLVKGDYLRTEAFRQLEVVPALLDRCLQMECPFEAIEAALAYENTWQLSTESLWNALQCVKRNIGCPVAGEWGVWGEWSACGARCGIGVKWKLRRCDTPAPSHSQLICVGAPLQAENCIGDQCVVNNHDAGGNWGPWNPWSSCSTLCGSGVRRRRRICLETNKPRDVETWRTHCQGQHDQIEGCENDVCYLDGGWSGWSGWGPCSQTCGAGKHSRTRTCTRPVPTENGTSCVGPRVEIGACHLVPCEVYKHTIAVLNGESYLHYDLEKKRATLFHCYVRFYPLSPHGTLMRRQTGQDAFVRLSLQKWHVCVDACDSGQVCCLPRSCSRVDLEPDTWHNVLVTVTTDGSILRLDDAPNVLKTPWPCDPGLTDDKMHIFIGEKLQAQIHEVMLNFIPLHIASNQGRTARNSDFFPTSTSNIAYKTAEAEEAYLHIDNEHYFRLPCIDNQDEWRLELTLKPKSKTGTILVMSDEQSHNRLLLDLHNTRLKLKLILGSYRTESSSTTECPPNQWIDVALSKKRHTHAIEASINGGESLHVLFEDDLTRTRRETTALNNMTKIPIIFPLCTDEFYVGGAPYILKKYYPDFFTPFSGIIASMRKNGELIDLHAYDIERQKGDKIQVSSRSASISGSYHETAWGKSGGLNLTCIHARSIRSLHTASWLFLDTAVRSAVKGKSVRSVDDGKVLRLVATADDDLRGFYTCRSHSNKQTRNVVTYGVLGKIQNKLTSPDLTTAFALVTTLSLVLGTIIWLVIEGVHDLRTGYGFFRDCHLSPEEEAEAVCKYIDQNVELIGSNSVAKIAKSRARRRGRQLISACRSSFAAQEPQGMQENFLSDVTNYTPEPEGLPDLPEVRSSNVDRVHDVYRCEPCYVSSPQHGSITTPNTRLTTSSSFALVSPRVLCSRVLPSKGPSSSRVSIGSIKKYRKPTNRGMKLSTIESSRYALQSPAHKILQKFSELKDSD